MNRLIAFLLLFPTAAIAASGGPDSHGYHWLDSNSGVPFEWVDISSTGTAVLTGNAVSAGNIELDVPWGGIYGKPVSQIRVSRNGYITNALTASGDDESNDCPLPAALPIADIGWRIYPLHDDLELAGTTGQVLYQYFPKSPHPNHGCGVHVITWKNVHHSGGASRQTFSFQTLLFDNLDILFQYGPGNLEGGLGSTTGIQNPLATIGLSIYCNEIEISDDFAILIEPPELTVNTFADELDTPAGTDVSLREAVRDIADGGRVAIDSALDGKTVSLSPALGAIGLSGKSVAIDASGLETNIHISGGNAVSHFALSNSWLGLDRIYLEKAAGGSIDLTGSGLVACNGAWVANTDSTGSGAAISMLGSGCRAGFYRCDFLSNHTQLNGGAVSVGAGAKLRLEECRLWRNRCTVGDGGAISLADSAAVLRFCDIAMNTAIRGGGLSIGSDVDVDLFGCTFDDNRASDGGGISLWRASGSASSSARFSYCTLFGNCAKSDGGAAWESGFGLDLDLDFHHCTVFKNSAGGAGGAFYFSSGTVDASVQAIVMADNGGDQLAGAGTLDSSLGDNLETGFEGNFWASSGESLIEDIGLTDLGHFGGYVRVCMPLQHFPGIDRAPSSASTPGDARGFPAPRDGGSPGAAVADCGAVELGPTVTVTNADVTGPDSLQAALDVVESGGVVTFDDDGGDLEFIDLDPGGFTIPADTTVFVDASPVGRVHIHNFETYLHDGQDLALHAIDVTKIPDPMVLSPPVRIEGSFTAHDCNFLGFGDLHFTQFELGGPSSILRSSFRDTDATPRPGLAVSILISSGGSTLVARDSLWHDNYGDSSPQWTLIAITDGVGCIQRCSFVRDPTRGSLNDRALEARHARSAGAWLFCESNTFSSSGDIRIGTGSTADRGETHAELSHNTIIGNSSDAPFRAALTIRSTFFESFCSVTLTGNIIADNAFDFFVSGSAAITSGGSNLSDDTPSFFTAADIPNTDPLLGPLVLGRHGTLVHVPRPGSPCIDAGPILGMPLIGCNDGRGFFRSFDGDADGNAQIDIGAVESGRVLMVTTIISENDGSLGLGTGDSLHECLDESETLGGVNIGFAPALLSANIDFSTGGNTIEGLADVDGLGRGIIIKRASNTAIFHTAKDSVFSATDLTLRGSVRAIDRSRISLNGCEVRNGGSFAGSAAAGFLDTTFAGSDDLRLLHASGSASVLFDGCHFHDNICEEIFYINGSKDCRFMVKDSVLARNSGRIMTSFGGATHYFSGTTVTRHGDRWHTASTKVLHRKNLIVNNHEPFFGAAINNLHSLHGNLIDSSPPNFVDDLTNRSGYLAPLADYDGDGRLEMPPLAASPAFDTDIGNYRTAGVITVTTTTNQDDTPAGPEVSLREAVRDVPEGGTIVFAPGLNGATVDAGHTLVFDKTLNIDATSLPLGIDLDSRLAWTNGHRLALHGVHIRDVVTGIDGGAIRCIGTGGTFIASHCTFSNNTSSASGSGIYIQNGTLVLENCTLANNSASTGSAISKPNTIARIEFCTISGGNSSGAAIDGSGDVEFGSNVVFGNRDNGNLAPTFGVGVTFLSLGHNQFEDIPAGADATDATNVLALPSQFSALGNFGGWVETYQLANAAGPVDFTPAPASDVVPAPEFDARGFLRVAGISADGGAHELAAETEDRDADGLPDWWELLHGLDPEVANDPDADSDGDGATLLAEFFWRTDPHDATSFPDVSLDPGPHFTFNTIPGYTYLIESSGNMVAWIPELTITATSDSYTFEDSAGAMRRFYRATRIDP